MKANVGLKRGGRRRGRERRGAGGGKRGKKNQKIEVQYRKCKHDLLRRFLVAEMVLP